MAVLEDGSYFDTELLAAIPALVGALILEGVYLVHAATVGASLPVAPSDACQVVNTGLFIWEAGHQLGQGLECWQHTCLPQLYATLILAHGNGSVKYIVPYGCLPSLSRIW